MNHYQNLLIFLTFFSLTKGYRTCYNVYKFCQPAKSDRTTDMPETKRSLHTQGPKTKNLLEGSQNDEKDRKALL